jgi:hypothetical protein
MLEERYTRDLAGDVVGTLARKQGMAHPTPQRERGLWSFLTWSFFLSQIAAGSAFIGNAAKAAEAFDGSNRDSNNSGSETAAKALPGADAQALSFEDASSNDAHGATAAQGHANLATGPYAADVIAATESVIAPQSGEMDDFAASGITAAAGDSEASIPPTAPLIDMDTTPGPVVGDVLTPVLETVGDVADSLGDLLGDSLAPVVETVEDLVGVLTPVVDQVFAPVEAITETVADVLNPIVDQVLSPVLAVADGVLDAAAPLIDAVAAPVDALLAIADPMLDTLVDPLIAPAGDIVDALTPVLEPVLDAAAPLVDAVQPVLEPVVDALSPVLTPVVGMLDDHLPLNIGGTGLLDSLLGNSESVDAIASPGQIEFPAINLPVVNEIFQGGTYTEYGVALQDTSPLGEPDNAIELVGNVAVVVSDLVSDDDNNNGLPLNIASLNGDLNLRALADGLM